MSDTKLTRLESEAKRRGLGRRVSDTKALEDARAQWREFSEWGRKILHPDCLPEELAVIAAKESTPFFDTCDECKDRIQKGEPAVTLRAWAWHTLDHGHTTETPAPVASASIPPVEDASTDAQLTTRLREALGQQEPSARPTAEPAAVATDLPKPSPVAPSPPSKPVYPILHRDCGIFGDCLELEDHVKIDVFVFDNGRVEGGEAWPKNLFRHQNGGRLPWNE